MSRESKYLTSKSVFMPIVWSLLTIAAGVAFWMTAPGMSPSGFWVGLPCVVIGLAAVVNNILSCCWYPVLLDRHIVLEHFLFPGLSRVIRYEDVQYMRVAEFLVRRYDRSPVLTVRMKDGKRRSFILMTRLEQIGQLRREILDKGVPDAMPLSVADRKVYLSFKVLAMFVLILAAMAVLYVWIVMELASPLIIVVTVMFVPMMLVILYTLSYVVIEDGRVMLKYPVFRSRNLDISIDDVCDMGIGPGSHMDILLKTPDKHGKSRYTRVVSLANIDMMQEINACVAALGRHSTCL